MLKRWASRCPLRASLFIDALGEVVDLDGEAVGHLVEDGGIDADSGLLHAQKDGDEREIDGVVDICNF